MTAILTTLNQRVTTSRMLRLLFCDSIHHKAGQWRVPPRQPPLISLISFFSFRHLRDCTSCACERMSPVATVTACIYMASDYSGRS
jgi:hypothetical protein